MYLGFTDRFHAEKVRQFTAAMRPASPRTSGKARLAPVRRNTSSRPPPAIAGRGEQRN